jgi:hypothetical protein
LNGIRLIVLLLTFSSVVTVIQSDEFVLVSLHNSLTDISLPPSNEKGISNIILMVSLLIPTVLAIFAQLLVVRERKQMKKGLHKLIDKQQVVSQANSKKYSTKTNYSKSHLMGQIKFRLRVFISFSLFLKNVFCYCY